MDAILAIGIACIVLFMIFLILYLLSGKEVKDVRTGENIIDPKTGKNMIERSTTYLVLFIVFLLLGIILIGMNKLYAI